jgi:hypothetical protein
MLHVTRGELEVYVRHLESRGYAAATVARRFGTVATFYKYAVIDELIVANPAVAVTRPKVAWEGGSAPCCTRWGRRDALRGTQLKPGRPRPGVPARDARSAGLRGVQREHHDIRYESGYELLQVVGKGSKPGDIPMPIPVLRAVKKLPKGGKPDRSCAPAPDGEWTAPPLPAP